MSIKRRFIAGAKCPQCQATDTVRACLSPEREWMECVQCGYEEERPTEVTPKQPETGIQEGVVIFKPQ